jgi:hypothetical protein
MATMPNTNINIPYSAFLDPITGRPSQPWLLWLMSPSFINITLGSALPVSSGGTGLTTIPTNGQLLIGNGTGYTLNTLGFGAGISITNGLGTIVVANTGVLSFSAGTTGLLPAAATTGNVTLSGVLKEVNGGTGQSIYTIGDLLYASTTTTLSKLADVATGNALISGGVITAPSWGKIGLTTHVSGVLPIANGGTNTTATPTAYGIAYGTGTAYAFTAAGMTGQILTATTGSAPTWASPATSGTVSSVSGTGTVNGISLSGTVTTTGSLTLGGSLSGVSLTSQVSGILPVANGGNGSGAAYLVATLPSAGVQGRRAWVTDALAPVFLSAPTGSGTVITPVFDNGSAWVVG